MGSLTDCNVWNVWKVRPTAGTPKPIFALSS
jgi:hypothetical protein